MVVGRVRLYGAAGKGGRKCRLKTTLHTSNRFTDALFSLNSGKSTKRRPIRDSQIAIFFAAVPMRHTAAGPSSSATRAAVTTRRVSWLSSGTERWLTGRPVALRCDLCCGASVRRTTDSVLQEGG